MSKVSVTIESHCQPAVKFSNMHCQTLFRVENDNSRYIKVGHSQALVIRNSEGCDCFHLANFPADALCIPLDAKVTIKL